MKSHSFLKLFWIVPAFLLLSTQANSVTDDDRPQVDMLLVLAIDSSGSTRDGDFVHQIRGHSAAFRDRRVVAALTSGQRGRIAVAAIVWSDDAQQWRCVEWMLIASVEDAATFADRLQTCPFIGGGTSIGGALRNARNVMGWSPYKARRRVIDISANERSAWVVEPARFNALRAGITINALVIETAEQSLLPYFSRFVIGGPGAFVVGATQESYTESLKWKLQTESAGHWLIHPPRLAQVMGEKP